MTESLTTKVWPITRLIQRVELFDDVAVFAATKVGFIATHALIHVDVARFAARKVGFIGTRALIVLTWQDLLQHELVLSHTCFYAADIA